MNLTVKDKLRYKQATMKILKDFKEHPEKQEKLLKWLGENDMVELRDLLVDMRSKYM